MFDQGHAAVSGAGQPQDGEARSLAVTGKAAGSTASETPHASPFLAALDVQRQEPTVCPTCHCRSLQRWGTNRRKLQRWRCRGCRRSFTAATGTPLALVHMLDKLRAVAIDMLDRAPRSCRSLAVALGIDRMTVWRWRKLIAGVWAVLQRPVHRNGCHQQTSVILRDSRKASREWVDHGRDPARYPAPDRLRWIDYRLLALPLPRPMTPYRVSVLLDGGAPAGATVVSMVEGSGHVARTSPPGPAPAARTSRTTITGKADGGAGVTSRGDTNLFPPDELGDMTTPEQFRHFLAPFRGPATRHLRTYTAWFGARLRTTIRNRQQPADAPGRSPWHPAAALALDYAS